MGRERATLSRRVASFTQSWWAVAVIAALMSVILYQRWQGGHPARPQALRVGEHLPAIMFESMEGQPVRIVWETAAGPTVLYAFTPGCTWCKRNTESLRALADGASPQYRFIGVSLAREGLKDYLDTARFKFPVYIAAAERGRLKLSVTPETIVVSPNGTIAAVWLGAYRISNAASIAQHFGFKLPVVESD